MKRVSMIASLFHMYLDFLPSLSDRIFMILVAMIKIWFARTKDQIETASLSSSRTESGQGSVSTEHALYGIRTASSMASNIPS